MRKRTTTGAILFVALWATLAASCGGAPSKEEYGREVNDTLAEVEKSYGGVGQTTGGGTDDAAADDSAAATSTEDQVQQLEQTQIGLRDAANRLSEIEAPDGLADDHEQLVAGVRDMADAIDTLIEAQRLADTDSPRARELMQEFATDDAFRTVEAAARNIRKAGVDVSF